MASQLPWHFMEQVLLKLPVKSRVRASTVCKGWQQLFEEKWTEQKKICFGQSADIVDSCPQDDPSHEICEKETIPTLRKAGKMREAIQYTLRKCKNLEVIVISKAACQVMTKAELNGLLFKQLGRSTNVSRLKCFTCPYLRFSIPIKGRNNKNGGPDNQPCIFPSLEHLHVKSVPYQFRKMLMTANPNLHIVDLSTLFLSLGA